MGKLYFYSFKGMLLLTLCVSFSLFNYSLHQLPECSVFKTQARLGCGGNRQIRLVLDLLQHLP